MCGIGAIFTKEPLDCVEEIALAMAKRQQHRGPDHQDIYATPDHCVALSHSRLSIVDLSSRGNQPMANEDASLWLVCNGEIYNYRELRHRLETKGHAFNSHSDSEVILHLYEQYGPDLLQYLHGMFAFAIYDSAQNLLFCARDRLGKKPLVYAQTSQGVALASEIPAVRCFPGIDISVDPVALGLYLLRNIRHIPDPWTFYTGIRRLMPGHAMIVKKGTVKKIWRYWHPDFKQQEVSVEELREAFDRAVAIRRVADIEVGALLSGGVDSSGIVHAMVAQGSKRVRTYAMGLNKEDEELVRARRMAQFLGTEHKEFYFDPEQQLKNLDTLLRIHGEPIMLLPLLHTYELCEHIRDDGMRVVMAGHGADELFYGYEGNNKLALISAILPFVPSAMRPWLKALALKFPRGFKLREALLVAASSVGDRKAELYRDEAKQIWTTLLNVPQVESLINEHISRWLGTWFEESRPSAYIDEANIIGLMHENTHSITISCDLPAMAASVETRAPFLDQDLVQLAWRIPYRQKIKSFWDKSENKWILKKVLQGRVPNDLLYAPKRGFGYHIHEEDLLRGSWKSHVDEAFANLDGLGGILNTGAVRTLKTAFDKNEGVPANLIAKLFAVYRTVKMT